MGPIAKEVQLQLRKELKRRFVDEERVGHTEDLVISTLLDPR